MEPMLYARPMKALDVYKQHFIWPAAAAAQAEQDEYEPEHPKLQALELDGDREVLLAQMCGNEARRVAGLCRCGLLRGECAVCHP